MPVRLFPATVSSNWVPSDYGYKAWSIEPGALAAASNAPSVAGRLELVRIHLPTAAPITNIVMTAGTGGSTLTAGQCFAALFTAAGAFVGVTGDQSAAWATSGTKVMPLAGGPFNCAAGDLYAGPWYNGTTSPAWARSAGLTAAAANPGLSAPNLRVCSADTGLTTTAPGSLGAQTAAAIQWWVALS